MNAFPFDTSLYTCSDSALECRKDNNCFYVFSSSTEPTSVLDSRRSPLSSTTMSSSLGCHSSGAGGSALEKCGGGGGAFGGIDEWESMLSESQSPSQEQSILRLIMGDVVEDQSLVLHRGNNNVSHDFNEEFLDQSFNFEQHGGGGGLVSSIDSCSLPMSACSDFPFSSLQNVGNYGSNDNNASRLGLVHNLNPSFSNSSCGVLYVSSPPRGLDQQIVGRIGEKPHILDSQVIVNQNQVQFTQNQTMFLPFLNAQIQEHVVPPPPKRLNSDGLGMNYQVPKFVFSGCGEMGQEMFLGQHQQQPPPQVLPNHLQQRPTAVGVPSKQKMMSPAGDELANNQLIVDQLFKAAEYVETGNQILAQEILARLNHHIFPIGKAFHRAAYYFKEALQMLLHLNIKNPSPSPHFDIIFKIKAYKSFSEVLPVIQFSSLTCNQAILEAVEGFDRIHIIDFDIGYGGQWSSLIQELALRKEGAPTLKITAFSSPLNHDQIELGFTREGLKDFAQEVNMPFELEIVNLGSLNVAFCTLPVHVSKCEAIVVNLPVATFSSYPLPLPVLLRSVKQLSPKIVVSLDLGCERTESGFPNFLTHALQSYASLLESLDAVNVNLDALQKIERFLLQPSIKNLVLGHQRYHERTPPWRSLFLSSGFSPIKFSNFAESQAECLLQRTPAQGFHVEKSRSSLVLCWQQKVLISASAWKC